MPAYAAFTDVQARAGRFSGALTVAGQRPNQADVEAILADLSAQVDVAIQARGYDPAGLDATVKLAFRDMVAFGAIARAFSGFPDPAEELEKLVSYASRVWGTAMGDPTSKSTSAQKGSIATGSHPAIAALEAGKGGAGGQSAGSLWEDEPDYGSTAQVEAERLTLTAELAPTFAKSQSL